MDGFIPWFLREKGWLDTDSMGLTDIPGQGRGAVALKDISEGHTLFTIPRSLTLSTRTSELPNLVGETAWKSFQLNKGWVGLILCMMWEESRGPGSKWSGYFDILPKIFDTPMFWSEDDLKELEGTAVLEKIGKEEAERDYHEKLVPAVQSRPDIFNPAYLSTHYSLENYHRMGSRILSRSFQVEQWQREDGQQDSNNDDRPEETDEVQESGSSMNVDDDNQGEGEASERAKSEDIDEDEDEDEDPSDVAMVPMADMLNARYGSENAKLFYERLELKMMTTKPIKAGEQIYNTYGDPPNSDLLRRYGHVDLVPLSDDPPREGNPADVVEVRADLAVEVVSTSQKDVDSEVLKERIDWWLEEGGDDVFVFGTDYDRPDALISFFKLLLLPPADWEKARSKNKPPKPKLDQEAKLRVLPLVLDSVEKRLAKYPTSLEYDESLLTTQISHIPTSNTQVRLRNALIVRIGEKRILKGCAAKCKALLEAAQSATRAIDSRSEGRPGRKPKGVNKSGDQRKRKRDAGPGADGEKARKRTGR